ncbi:Lrp/AsnC family transcriptional regulator [Rhodospirillum centenum]|uniref:Bkd operon transcriptional regulator n=1 Tax=Rhodospirillum centenum (strain ATCC 51521 / SW) TaxID=414684 RepID=B6IV28_RHOCS|nr:Lrp/AsnC family transcriptional regulator [Rhodospirillum centenum]ACJ00152.1 Bkd operon transcriptional regulator [Rhodospirillum centenum SW]
MSRETPKDLDRTDWRILDHLQKDGAATAAEVAERVGLSQSPCWRRIQRLEGMGVIRRRVALLDRKRLGLNVLIFSHVKLEAHSGDRLEEFRDAIRRIPEVQECFVLMGQVDFLLRIVAADIEAYEKLFFEKLSKLPGVREINSMIAVSAMKETTELPLPMP